MSPKKKHIGKIDQHHTSTKEWINQTFVNHKGMESKVHGSLSGNNSQQQEREEDGTKTLVLIGEQSQLKQM